MSPLPARTVIAMVLVVAGSLIGSCGFVGGGEPNEISVALTSRNPVVADLSLSSAERTRFMRPGEEAMGLPLGMAEPSRTITQRFEANPGFSPDDVAAEVIAIAADAGWEITPGVTDGSWCGDRGPGNGSDRFTITRIDAGGELGPGVLVTLNASGSCYRPDES